MIGDGKPVSVIIVLGKVARSATVRRVQNPVFFGIVETVGLLGVL